MSFLKYFIILLVCVLIKKYSYVYESVDFNCFSDKTFEGSKVF